MAAAGWNVKELASAATKVEFENTNFLATARSMRGLWSRRRPDVCRL